MAVKQKQKKSDAEKLLDVALGALVQTREKISDALDELIQKAEEKAKEVKERFEERESCEEEEKESILAEQLQKAAKALGIATKKQIDEIEEKIDKLLAKKSRKKK